MTAVVEDHRALGVEELPVPPPPIGIGPTWAVNPNWTPGSQEYKYILPERTLGWQIQAWVEGVPELGIPNHINDLEETDDYGNPLPFHFSEEQLRFVLWMYAIDEEGRFPFRDIVFQRLKGHGKDPIGAVLAAVELVGPCRFAYFADDQDDVDELAAKNLRPGDPVAKRHPRAWVQIAAVSKKQTVTTMSLFPGLFTKETIAEHNIDIGKETIYAHGGRCRLDAVTSNPKSLEGGRPTFVIKNETHHWLENNRGHEMAEVIQRNSTKAKGGMSRTISLTNAYEPGQESVAQQERESWEQEVESGWKVSTMYDSLEAAPGALMRLPNILTKDDPDPDKREWRAPTEEETRAYIGAVLEGVRGDSVWLDIPTIIDTILQPRSSVTTSRRFYYNQILAAEDSWVHGEAVEAAVDPDVRAMRRETGADQLRVGWAPVGRDEEVVLFFDGSKSMDSTALVGCRVSDGYVFTVGVWQQPAGERGARWLAPRAQVDERVHEAHRRFNVIAFWGDPSHALEDDDSTRYWDAMLDSWHQKYRLRYKLWAVKAGHRRHSVMWDMTSPMNQEIFVRAAERFVGEIEALNDVEEFAPTFRIDGFPALMTHLRNARAYEHPKVNGVSLHKGSRRSKRKIDLAVCAVGARMVRHLYLNQDEDEQEKPHDGHVW